jgi:hypothetical protein
MYAVIRRYQFDPKSSEEISHHVRESFIPLLRKTPGFVTYHWLDTGDGVGASLSIFNDKAGAEESVRLAAAYVQEHLAGLLGKPEVTQGEVKAHA